ncbi:MAG TPA: hypothetical protein PL070_13625 [Flavobacteriales bacterium]|nr:hypothetical protein [Flavobacteriales bacterium]
MIDIRTKLLSKPSSRSGLGDSVVVFAANSATEALASTIKKGLKGKACPTHNPGRGTITVTAAKKKMFIVQKSGFCCKDFENSIVITTK